MHHLQYFHQEQLRKYCNKKSLKLDTLTTESGVLEIKPFSRQEQVTTAIVKNLISEGVLPISLVTQPWFREFMKQILPTYQPPSRDTVVSLIESFVEKSKAN